MTTATDTIKVKDLFEQTVGRAAGRQVRVIRKVGLTPAALQHIERMKAMHPASADRDEHVETVRQRRTYYYVKTETHPLNPDTVGRVSRVSEQSLLASGRYKKVSD